MNDYREVHFKIKPTSEDAADLLAAFLADNGYESFVADDEGMTAYVKAEDFDKDKIDDILSDFPMDVSITYNQALVEGRDWNREWELNYFQPIVVGDRCVIHSSFHTDIPTAEYDIVIDPKMAFGTGHHATTSQVIEALLSIDLKGKSLIDMGTGTAILAILASMRGAHPVTGIEIDSFAYTNALENVALNLPEGNVTLINGDASALENIKPVDIFVANINRNVITGDIAAYARVLKQGGTMILSGFYDYDIPVIAEASRPYGLVEVSHSVLNNWTCLILVKQ
ncbi:MAG: 50S ribosomal protein L11 methyltransferase [Muribaculaceae bacterium]|nr:50S ribosomal protein L11 methyltransferase [Muribaculaceae bacterium]